MNIVATAIKKTKELNTSKPLILATNYFKLLPIIVLINLKDTVSHLLQIKSM